MLKIGVLGCKRSIRVLPAINLIDDVSITAAYDINNANMKKFSELHPSVVTYSDEDSFLSCSDFDAVYIATPASFHFEQVIKSLSYGKHVLCEVPIAYTVEQARVIKLKAESMQLVCMMAENFCFTPLSIFISDYFKKELFGEITFIRTGYIHDCRELSFDDNTGELSWRGKERTRISGNDYPTHSIGPVAKWLGVGSKGVKFESITSFSSREASLSKYAERYYPRYEKGQFSRGDVSISLIETNTKVVIELVLDTVSNRPDQMAELYIQGTKGALLSGRFQNELPVLALNEGTQNNIDFSPFDPLDKLITSDRFIQKKLKKLFPFYKVLQDFRNTIELKNAPVVSLNDSLLWSSIIELSRKSVMSGSKKIFFSDDFQS